MCEINISLSGMCSRLATKTKKIIVLFILHFIKVYITDRFMNKNWERDQIDRLVTLQQKKIDHLQTKINEETSI